MLIFFIPVLLIIFLLFIHHLYASRPKFSLKNKHIIITGGSSGIGKSVGIEAAKLGANITILARDKNKLNSAETEIKQHCVIPSQKVRSVSVDVTNFDSVDLTLKQLDAEDPIFMLVNCAGMAICGKIEDTTLQEIKTLIDLNFLGTLYPIRTTVPLMKKRKMGIIVLTASQAALFGIYGLATYSATKYALRGLAEGLEMELRPHNITVTLSMPPDTDTPGYETENKSKPKETQMISESGGLFAPDVVAKKLIDDALKGNFYSYVGFESFLLSTLCCGMTPFLSFGEVLFQSLLLGPFRLICAFYILKFRIIIQQSKQKSE